MENNNCVDLHEEAGELAIERYRSIILKLIVVKNVVVMYEYGVSVMI
jgi:hypothetical protein